MISAVNWADLYDDEDDQNSYSDANTGNKDQNVDVSFDTSKLNLIVEKDNKKENNENDNKKEEKLESAQKLKEMLIQIKNNESNERKINNKVEDVSLQQLNQTPKRHCSQVTISGTLPYTLKSVWSSPFPQVSSNNNGAPCSTSPFYSPTPFLTLDFLNNVVDDDRNGKKTSSGSRSNDEASSDNSLGDDAVGEGKEEETSASLSAKKISSSTMPKLIKKTTIDNNNIIIKKDNNSRGNSPTGNNAINLATRKSYRAIEELVNVLRNSNNICNGDQHSLCYNDLSHKSQWRSRFQTCFGSLFTFLKRHKEIFTYKQFVVTLNEGYDSIMSELSKSY